VNNKHIYFDNSATTQIDEEVLKAMMPYFSDHFGNASSLHHFGQNSMAAIDKSRDIIATFLGCQSKEIIFTAGATASNNMVIQGLVKPGQHIITSKIEHHSVLEPCQEMEKRGVAVSYIDINNQGLVLVAAIKQAVKENTKLVSIIYVNNEIGTIQPIAEIGQLIKELNNDRQEKIYFHIDAAQAPNSCDLNVSSLGVDLASLSGHKIYGPKGIGILFLKEDMPLQPIQFGGHQESGLAPGTLNVPAIVGIGKAIELIDQGNKVNEKIKKFRDKLISEIPKLIPNTKINGDLKKRIPGNAHFSFKGVEGENIFLLLDQVGIAVSTGSACSSGSLEPSHVILALGVDPILANGSLRITLGKFNTAKEVNQLLEILPSIVAKLRK